MKLTVVDVLNGCSALLRSAHVWCLPPVASRTVNFGPAIAVKKIIDISIEYPNDRRCCGNVGYLQLDEPRIPLFHRSGCTRCIASCMHATHTDERRACRSACSCSQFCMFYLLACITCFSWNLVILAQCDLFIWKVFKATKLSS